MTYKHDAPELPPQSDAILTLYFQLVGLKRLLREGYARRGIPLEQVESVGDHSWGVSVLGYLIASEYRPDLDASKVAVLGLFHEIGEVYAGDITPRDGVSIEAKLERERSAVAQLFLQTPELRKYAALWEEYAAGQTPEAKFAQGVNQLEMALQTTVYQGLGYTRLNDLIIHARERLTSSEQRNLLERLISPTMR